MNDDDIAAIKKRWGHPAAGRSASETVLMLIDELEERQEIARCARGVVYTAHPGKIHDAVVKDWWDALVRAVEAEDKQDLAHPTSLRDHLIDEHKVARLWLAEFDDEQLEAWHTLDHRLRIQDHPYA